MRGPTAHPAPPADVRAALAVHTAFGVVALAVVLWPVLVFPGRGAVAAPPALGWRLVGLVALYHAALGWAGRHRAGWTELWAFVAPISVFQVVPDVVLSGLVGTLRFAELGGPYVGPVPLAMAGMWAIPLWLSTAAGLWARSAAVAGGVAGLLFVGAEATIGAGLIWEAVGVGSIGPVALYVIGPEILLGMVTYVAYQETAGWPWPRRVAVAAAISAGYLAAALASHALLAAVLP